MDWKGRAIYTVGIICCLFFVVPIKIKKQPTAHELLFKSFVETHNKSYIHNETEYLLRYKNFQDSLRIIDELNANRSGDDAEYGITNFCDLSQEEFRRKHLQRPLRYNARHQSHRTKRAPVGDIPDKWDWRDKGVITAVKHQKSCGACWAFSTIETIESMNALKNRTLMALSVQQAIDCAGNGNMGCLGGDPSLLLEWLKLYDIAIEPDSVYPYIEDKNVCKYVPRKDSVKISSFLCQNMISKEDAILNSIAKHGPVTVAINASNWQFYLGKIIKWHCDGDVTSLNHAVQIVGFDNSATTPYYIVRNSWGSSFGNSGYIYIQIGSNMCGLANNVCSIDVV